VSTEAQVDGLRSFEYVEKQPDWVAGALAGISPVKQQDQENTLFIADEENLEPPEPLFEWTILYFWGQGIAPAAVGSVPKRLKQEPG